VTTTLTINRRGWLAVWAQDRRRSRCLLPAPVLAAQYPSLAVWDWPYADPFRWNAYDSLDGGVTWNFIGFEDGDARLYAPDGNQPMLIVGVDSYGREITGRSNVIQVDDAPAPGSFLSLEDGSAMQLENGSNLLLQ
jgi:hypothetical protein